MLRNITREIEEHRAISEDVDGQLALEHWVPMVLHQRAWHSSYGGEGHHGDECCHDRA